VGSLCSFRFVRRNFAEFIKKPAFMNLSEGRLKDYVSHPNLVTPTEETVLEAVLSWCAHNDALASSFSALATHVRFDRISGNYLQRLVEENADVCSNVDVRNDILAKMQSAPERSRPRFSTRVRDGAFTIFNYLLAVEPGVDILLFISIPLLSHSDSRFPKLLCSFARFW
jgi:hypothetical protein